MLHSLNPRFTLRDLTVSVRLTCCLHKKAIFLMNSGFCPSHHRVGVERWRRRFWISVIRVCLCAVDDKDVKEEDPSRAWRKDSKTGGSDQGQYCCWRSRHCWKWSYWISLSASNPRFYNFIPLASCISHILFYGFTYIIHI